MTQSLHTVVKGQGIPLVLLHGWGLNSAIFTPLVEVLAQQYKVITIDLPGYGHSVECVPEDYSLAVLADLVTQAVGEPAIYIGWSLGGLVATQVALGAANGNVLGLVTVASSPCFEQKENWPGIKPELLNGFHQQIAKNIGQTLNGFLKIQAMGSPHLKDDIKLIQQLVMAAPLPDGYALEQGLNLLANADFRQQLREITQPFLRIYGKMDGLVPRKIIEQVNELSPHSNVVVFDKASHAPFISNFQDFIDILVDWLTTQKLVKQPVV